MLEVMCENQVLKINMTDHILPIFIFLFIRGLKKCETYKIQMHKEVKLIIPFTEMDDFECSMIIFEVSISLDSTEEKIKCSERR